MSELSMPLQSPITILGAGIGGLTLGQCLRQKGIPSVLYEKDSASEKRHSYGITLHPFSSHALSNLLGLNLRTLRQQTAVDRLDQDGVRQLHAEEEKPSTSDPPGSFDANRARLEELLRKGLYIKFDHPVERTVQYGQLSDLSHLIVDALGVHSILRLSFLPNSTPTVLPYVVFNGQRRISFPTYQKTYAQNFRDTSGTCFIYLSPSTNSPVIRLHISVDQHHPLSPSESPPAPAASGAVDISYTYSRPARTQTPDPLHNPTRSTASASTIPPEFYVDMASLSRLPPGPFLSAFAPKPVRQDRVLHWLMRTTLISRTDLSSLASLGIVFIGDSAHATPILGGSGANAAIRDAIRLAKTIGAREITAPAAREQEEKGPAWRSTIEASYNRAYDQWTSEVGESERVIAEIHGQRPVASKRGDV